VDRKISKRREGKEAGSQRSAASQEVGKGGMVFSSGLGLSFQMKLQAEGCVIRITTLHDDFTALVNRISQLLLPNCFAKKSFLVEKGKEARAVLLGHIFVSIRTNCLT
jgi:hypothetical protein